MDSDESHFNVSLTVMDKVTRQCPETTIFEEKGESKRIRTEVPLLTSLTAKPNRFTNVCCYYCNDRIVAGVSGSGSVLKEHRTCRPKDSREFQNWTPKVVAVIMRGLEVAPHTFGNDEPGRSRVPVSRETLNNLRESIELLGTFSTRKFH